MAQFLALLHRDLSTVARSWLARGWLLASLILVMVTVMSQAQEGMSAADMAAAVQLPYVVLWSLVIIALTAGSITSEAGTLVDSVLSRPVKRYHYMLAKLASRSLSVLAIFLIAAVPATYCAWRYAGTTDLTFGYAVLGTTCVALVILFLVALGVALSSLLNSTLVAMVALALLWYVAGSIFSFLNVDYLSPFALGENLPEMFRGELGDGLMWKTPIGFLVPTAVVWVATIAHFSYKDV